MRQTQDHAVLPLGIPTDAVLPAVSPTQPVPPLIANYPVGLAHDARNVLAAMDIYCELLGGPGVLNPQYQHLADELRLLRESSSTLMDRLLILAIKLGPDDRRSQLPNGSAVAEASKSFTASPSTFIAAPSGHKAVASVTGELLASHRMLCALAGPKVRLQLNTDEAPEGELLIASADFTRVLINLVRNAAEAMVTGGQITISAKLAPSEVAAGRAAMVSVEDNGPGIPLSLLERIFEVSTAASSDGEQPRRRMSFRPRGLGLRIVRELVEAGGGVIRAARLPERGSRFEIVLPMVTKNARP